MLKGEGAVFKFFKTENKDRGKIEQQLTKSNDYQTIELVNNNTNIAFCLTYLSTLIEEKTINEYALPALLEGNFTSLEDARKLLKINDVIFSEQASDIDKYLLKGYVKLTVKGKENQFCFFAAKKDVVRSVGIPEVEFSVIGPKESFVESVDQNINFGKIADFISPEKMFFFKLLVDKHSDGLYKVKIRDGAAAIRSIHSSHRIKLTKRTPMEVTIEMKVNGIINEYTGEQITQQIKNELEKEFERMIEEECLMLVKHFQEKRLDPVGFGHFVKTKTRNFDFEKWKAFQYQKLVVRIKPNVQITETGIIQ